MCTNFIEQLGEEVSLIKISLCAIVTCRSANQNVDNRRQSRASLDSLLMELWLINCIYPWTAPLRRHSLIGYCSVVTTSPGQNHLPAPTGELWGACACRPHLLWTYLSAKDTICVCLFNNPLLPSHISTITSAHRHIPFGIRRRQSGREMAAWAFVAVRRKRRRSCRRTRGACIIYQLCSSAWTVQATVLF